MKQFNKTILAVALMAAAGSASANVTGGSASQSISVLNNAAELYMSAYDSTSKNTYSFNTGLTLATLLTHVNDAAYSASFNLSTDTNWTSGFAGFTAATTTYGLVVGSQLNPDFLSTSSAVGGLPTQANDTDVDATAAGIKLHAQEINVGMTSNSKVVNDSATVGTGQFTSFNTLFGNQSSPSAMAAGLYGSSLRFYHEGTGLNLAQDAFIGTTEAFVGGWKLSGNNLTFNAANVAAVPLPAAVWLFGAGLMGLLGLNRRKSMAV